MFLKARFAHRWRSVLLAAGSIGFVTVAVLDLEAASNTAKRQTLTTKTTQAAKANQAAKPRHPEKSFDIDFREFKLKNGLRVLLAEDHRAPTYSIAVTYNVGSRDERPGRTGFAHLFEHMLFQGSENVGKGEHFILVQNNGGSANGTTNQDRTNYFQTLPANQLDLGLFLEADRMRSLVINEANLTNQRHAVQEERKLG